MQTELSQEQWDSLRSGQVIGPSGVSYHRRSTRLSRRKAEDLLTQGAPILVHVFSLGQLEWFDGTDAQSWWSSEKRNVTSEEPRPKPRAHLQWSAGRWEADNGDVLLVLTGHC